MDIIVTPAESYAPSVPATAWIVYDRHGQCTVGKPYATKARARARAERLDLNYGAYRYGVMPA